MAVEHRAIFMKESPADNPDHSSSGASYRNFQAEI